MSVTIFGFSCATGIWRQRLLSTLLTAVLGAVMYAPNTAFAQEAQSWTINLQDADIKAFIQEVAAITKHNFIVDPRINGTVTVVSNRPLSEAELYQLFLSVMQVNGVSAVDTGLSTKLVPEAVAQQMGTRVDVEGRLTGDVPTTRIFHLSHANANDIMAAVRPLMSASAHAAVVSGSNTLVLADGANHFNEISKLIAQLDGPSS